MEEYSGSDVMRELLCLIARSFVGVDPVVLWTEEVVWTCEALEDTSVLRGGFFPRFLKGLSPVR